ncbi:kinase-like protein [Aspergillus filifer]
MERRTKQWTLKEEDRFGAHGMVQVYKVDPQTVVKLVEPPRLTEAETLRFVRANTSLPVPEVYDAYIDDELERGVIVMQYIDADALQDIWENMDVAEQDAIIAQLRGYMDELRAIRGAFVGPIDRSACEDPLFTVELGSFGPYADEEAFHGGIVRAIEMVEEGPWARQVAGFVSALPKHDIVLTHADLTPRNILVREGKVVGIIDWEMAGYFPAYWEYVKALAYPEWESTWYSEAAVDRVLRPFPLEMAVMMHVHNLV